MKRVRGAIEDDGPCVVLLWDDPQTVLAGGGRFSPDLEWTGSLDPRRAVGARRPGAAPAHHARKGRSSAEHGPIVANANLGAVHRLRHRATRAAPARLRLGVASTKNQQESQRCWVHSSVM